MFAVNYPVIDLRCTPNSVKFDYSHDDNRESQLLYGEPIKIIEQSGKWYRVQALLQSCEGWIQNHEIIQLKKPYYPTHVVCTANATLAYTQQTLSFGTLLEVINDQTIRLLDGTFDFVEAGCIRPLESCMQELTSDAHKFIGAPYLWGGCAASIPGICSSVDCSALVHLLFRAHGICLPRNARDQYVKGYEVAESLQPGDCLYLYKEGKPAHHVLMHLTDDLCIESPKTGGKVRLLQWEKTVKWKENGMLEVKGREPCHCIVKRFANLPRNLRSAFEWI